MSNSTYIGRFAPSPSGPLHLGSLMSATCSYLQAKSKQGQWLLRIEDVDTPRVINGAADTQLTQLESFGFEWDQSVLYQSSRFKAYQEIVDNLVINDMIYACECTRKHIQTSAKTSEIGFIYPQNCRHKYLDINHHSLRFKTQNKTIEFNDTVYGKQSFNVQNLSSDWVIKRIDGIFAYHLAVVADDQMQGITQVVRGLDILPLTPLHIELQNTLNYVTPSYLHHPLIEKNAQKLSKQNHASPLKMEHKIKTLNSVLNALGQNLIDAGSLNEFWSQAIKQWDVRNIPTSNFQIKS